MAKVMVGVTSPIAMLRLMGNLWVLVVVGVWGSKFSHISNNIKY